MSNLVVPSLTSSPNSSKAVELSPEEISVSKARCRFCLIGRANQVDPVMEAGKMYKIGGIVVHYFCVLFSESPQGGLDDEGLFGFRLADIRLGLEKASRHKCAFCHMPRAPVTCISQVCRKKKTRYHYTCGTANGAYFIHDGKFPSRCKDHGPKKQQQKLKVRDVTCVAGCMSRIDLAAERHLVSPCCGRIMHTECLQRMAVQSGKHHYKCPACAEKKTFLRESVKFGICVPERDAAWESTEEENFYGFEGMGHLRLVCDAEPCLCPKNRRHHFPGTDWEVIRCAYCGSKGRHIRCGGLDKNCPSFVCAEHEDGPESKRTRLESDNDEKCDSNESSSEDEASIGDYRTSSSDSDDDDLVEAKIEEAKRARQQQQGTSRQTSNDSDEEAYCEILEMKTRETDDARGSQSHRQPFSLASNRGTSPVPVITGPAPAVDKEDKKVKDLLKSFMAEDKENADKTEVIDLSSDDEGDDDIVVLD